MAELNQSTGNSPGRKIRTLKSLPRIDLTAMVDLAFLLITFFMLTTSLSKPSAMNVAMPVDAPPQPIANDRTMTVCLGDNNKVVWYMGTTENPQNVHFTSSSKIRSAFQEQMKNVLKETGKSIIVLVKPDQKSNFRDLVDVLDEIAITGIPVYAIVDITFDDKEMLAKY
ncbi:MAG: ExbD/TolR family protein [Sphingobacteriaceae bacterium]